MALLHRPRQQVYQYDAEQSGEKPAQRWIDLHTATRKAFLAELSTTPIAERAVRLRRLDRMSRHAEERGQFDLAAKLLEQAAKEVGSAYTNARVLTGSGGGPIEIAALTPEERDRQAVALLERAAQRRLVAGEGAHAA